MPRDTVAEIKNRLSIQDVVAPYVKLTRAGRSLKGLCPFHKEKTSSFTVSVERNSFHCFGCGVGGDAFTFIEKIEGLDFKGALKLLADKAGVEVVYDQGAREDATKLDRLREAMARAVEFYVSRLTPDSEALAYAISRGLTKETIKDWQIGVSPDDWRVLLEHLVQKGFSVEELKLAGLIKEADGKPGTYYDRFRNRLMFPIRDSAARTVAFTGRALSAKDEAKYLNSPETDLFHKSEILYGIDKAKEAIRTRGFALLVEGQMDLLHAHQAGFTNTVALSGTAFTERHASFLKRYSENLMLCLDADKAGLAATFKSALVALAASMRVKAVLLPDGKDPADLIQEDAKDFAKRVGEAKPVVEFFLNMLGSRERNSHRLVLAAERIVLPLIKAVKSPMEREHFISATARTLALSPEAVRESVGKIKDERTVTPVAPRTSKTELAPQEARRQSIAAVAVVYPETPLAERVKSEYARIVEAPLSLDGVPEPVLFRTEETFGTEPSEHAADELLNAFEEAVIREAYQEKVRELRQAEAAGDVVHVKSIEALVTKLSKRLAALTR